MKDEIFQKKVLTNSNKYAILIVRKVQENHESSFPEKASDRERVMDLFAEIIAEQIAKTIQPRPMKKGGGDAESSAVCKV